MIIWKQKSFLETVTCICFWVFLSNNSMSVSNATGYCLKQGVQHEVQYSLYFFLLLLLCVQMQSFGQTVWHHKSLLQYTTELISLWCYSLKWRMNDRVIPCESGTARTARTNKAASQAAKWEYRKSIQKNNTLALHSHIAKGIWGSNIWSHLHLITLQLGIKHLNVPWCRRPVACCKHHHSSR